MPAASPPEPDAPVIDRARAHLHEAASPGGGWGYTPGSTAAPEPTLLAVGAGCDLPLTWLQSTDLGWAGLMVPALVGPRDPALSQAWIDRILALKGNQYETAGDFDGSLVGWPWVADTFSWVEPTAWAIRSLRTADMGDHPRVVEGLRVLADRQCSDGGWNAGNPSMLGAELAGYLYLTGLVCTALPHHHPSVPAARTKLAGVVDRPSVLNLSWAILASLAHGWPVDTLVPLLEARQSPDGGFGRCDRTALAVMALSGAHGGPIEAPPPG